MDTNSCTDTPPPRAADSARRGAPLGLLDEKSDPDLRTVFGTLLRDSARLDTAIRRVRLTGLDLTPRELGSTRRIRVLLAELNALTLDMEAEALLLRPERARGIGALLQLLDQGLLQVKSAPLAGWTPDFSIFHDRSGPRRLLIGLHWFQRPYPHRGPAWAGIHGAGEAERAAGRFETLWAEAHDISPAVHTLLRRSLLRVRRAKTRSLEPGEIPDPSEQGITPEMKGKSPDSGPLGRS